MDKLIEARKIISEADKQIAELFQQRMRAVKQVAEYKKERGLPVFDASREDEVIRNIRAVTLDDIRETASAIFDFSGFVVCGFFFLFFAIIIHL